MGILIENRQKNIPIVETSIKKKAQAILNALDSPDAELSVLIVDDPQIAELNQQYLNHSGPTNVIAFPMQEGQYTEITPDLIGDVVISVDTANREAEQADLTFELRFDQLLIHGILHLFGYDHITNEKDARRMDAKSKELMELIGGM